eukprot:UN05982
MEIILDNDKFHMLFSVCHKFKSVDVDGDKAIRWDEFRDFFVDYDTFDLDEAKEFWNQIDVNGEGVITFKQYWNHTKMVSGAFDNAKKWTSSDKFKRIIPSIPKREESKGEPTAAEEKGNNIIQQLVTFGYDESAIMEAMEIVIDKYNINEIQAYLDKKEEKQPMCLSIEAARKLKGANREILISDADFAKVFGMNRTAFKAFKDWKQN